MTEIVIPADHGWHILSYAKGRVERRPIVAWHITGTAAEPIAGPITVDPAHDILCPDGSVTGTFGQFRSQDLWQEAQAQAQDPAGWADPSPRAAAARVTLLRSKPPGESKAAGLRRRRVERKERAGRG